MATTMASRCANDVDGDVDVRVAEIAIGRDVICVE